MRDPTVVHPVSPCLLRCCALIGEQRACPVCGAAQESVRGEAFPRGLPEDAAGESPLPNTVRSPRPPHGTQSTETLHAINITACSSGLLSPLETAPQRELGRPVAAPEQGDRRLLMV
ncbi:hypothetical protein GCM10009730_50160 [Streptomyces albidochromogenes]